MDQSLVFLPKMISETSEDVLKIGTFINTLKAEMQKISDFSLEIPCSLLILTGAIEFLTKEAHKMGWLEDAKNWPDSNVSKIENNKMVDLYKPLPRRGDMSSYKSWELFKPFSTTTSSSVNQIGKGPSAFRMLVKGNEPKRTNEGMVCKKKRRRCWTPELHRLFVHAIEQLGDAQVATPRQITEVMGVKGLTTDEVKSHLQKYRLHIQSSFPSSRQLKKLT